MKTVHSGEILRHGRLDRFADEIIAPENVSEQIVDAFRQVDRAAFAPADAQDIAYTDEIIRLKKNSTISQPTFVARMIKLLDLTGIGRVLEIGTASGYQAALLSHLAAEVYTVETDEELVQLARLNLDKEGYGEVTVVQSDGALGLAEAAPFNRIIVTAGLRKIPQRLIDQLAVGGKIVAPVSSDPDHYKLVVLSKISETETEETEHGNCQFVPLLSPEEGGWTNEALKQAEQERLQKQRQPVKEWLASVWQQRGMGYEATMKVVQGLYKESLALDIDLTEEQVLDIVGLSLDISQPVGDGSQSPMEGQMTFDEVLE